MIHSLTLMISWSHFVHYFERQCLSSSGFYNFHANDNDSEDTDDDNNDT